MRGRAGGGKGGRNRCRYEEEGLESVGGGRGGKGAMKR
jgi:hypothetical protein